MSDIKAENGLDVFDVLLQAIETPERWLGWG